VISSDSLAALPAVFSSGTKGPVLFKGVPLSISRESEVAFHAVTGSETAYSGVAGKPMTSKTPLVGKSLGLLTLVQGRNNARVAVSGSTDMLSNKFFSAAAGNAKIAADVLQWTFRQKSVLRASPLRHRIIETNEVSPSIYRINDIVEVAVDIAECTENVCKPFQGKDVQVEFTMLDPHVRTTLKSSSGNGTFSAVVKVPDTYGVFKWVLDYRRLGYSWLMEEVTVPVRPFRHYEYERFIAQAYPYYASAASMMAGFFALGFFFLYSAKESSSSK
jgi:oligosaccharyltransferase complex subunit beta